MELDMQHGWALKSELKFSAILTINQIKLRGLNAEIKSSLLIPLIEFL
jgi:hypothetical protein